MSVGKSLPHDAGTLHVSGTARYIDDIPSPANTLHLAFGMSDCAAGTKGSRELLLVRAIRRCITLRKKSTAFEGSLIERNWINPWNS